MIDADVPLGMLTDVISYMIDINLEKKQSLLAEVDVYRRTKLLLGASEERGRRTGGRSLEQGDVPPDFSIN